MLEVGALILSGVLGAALGRLLRLPMWPITGALVGSAIMHVLLHSTVLLPSGVGFVAQVLVGTAVGAAVLPGFARQVGRLILPVVIVVFTLVAAGISSAALMSYFNVLHASEAFLGLVPGGVGEMVAAASTIGADSALVAGIHVVRLLISLWMLPVMVLWARNWKRPETAPDDAAEA